MKNQGSHENGKRVVNSPESFHVVQRAPCFGYIPIYIRLPSIHSVIPVPRASAQEWPWSRKEMRGFFRGSRTSADRDPLVLLSRAEPDLVDAAYIKNQAFKGPEDLLHGEEADKVCIPSHCGARLVLFHSDQ